MSGEYAPRGRHIALFVPSLRGGGAERVMVMLANGFAERGHRVDLVLTRAEGPYLPEVSPQVRIVDLDKGRVLASLLPLARYLRRERPDTMLSALNHANVIAIIARALASGILGNRIPLVVSEHNTCTATRADSLGQAIIRSLMCKLYNRATSIVGVSRGVSEDLARLLRVPAERVITIYNPVVTDNMPILANKSPDHPWFESGSPPVIIGVGRLTPQKDFSTLICAFAELRKRRSCRLVILGEGELRSELQTLASKTGFTDDILFAGFTGNPLCWMRSSAVFVLSSAWEGLGNVLIEAMACGTPVVSTDCRSGPREILESGRWGRLVPVGDATALAKAMADTLDEASPPDVVARSADFSVDIAVSAYLRMLIPSDHSAKS
jgi:glycosyltransferase involved in cell wall biosynthesis